MTILKNVPIIYECNNYLIVNKPSGMFSQPADVGAWFRNKPYRGRPPVVLENLIKEHSSKDNSTSEWRTVHRLDYCVTGGMLIAKNKNAAIQFSRNLRKGGHKGFSINRRYVALVNGNLLTKSFNDEGVVSSLGMTTKYKRIDENCFILELVTGKKHQIRRHLAELLGVPILNGTKYGGTEILGINSSQIALHSASIHTKIGLQSRRHLIPLINDNHSLIWDRKYLDCNCNFIEEIRDILLQDWDNI